MEEVQRLLEQHMPTQIGSTIVHGDYRLGNMLVDSGSIRAVLDWELCTLGDPLADVGYLLPITGSTQMKLQPVQVPNPRWWLRYWRPVVEMVRTATPGRDDRKWVITGLSSLATRCNCRRRAESIFARSDGKSRGRRRHDIQRPS